MTDFSFTFVDLAGYTAASWVHGDDVAARLAIRLRDMARDCAGERDVVIKSIGDAVMCRSDEPSAALLWLDRLFAAGDREHQFPHLRAGSNHGPAVEHEGDFYGTAVNVAARVAALAAPCELLVTDATAASAHSLGWQVEQRGPQSLRNIAMPVEVSVVLLPSAAAAVMIDPVCRMRVRPDSAYAHLEYAGQAVWLCSRECHEAFVADPEAHVQPL